MTIDDGLERLFRQKAFEQSMNMRRGYLTEAVEQAMKLYIESFPTAEELKALRDYKSGKTKMVKVSAKEMIDELKELENE